RSNRPPLPAAVQSRPKWMRPQVHDSPANPHDRIYEPYALPDSDGEDLRPLPTPGPDQHGAPPSLAARVEPWSPDPRTFLPGRRRSAARGGAGRVAARPARAPPCHPGGAGGRRGVRALEAEWILSDEGTVGGEAGEADPTLAVEDALRRFPADEILLVGATNRSVQGSLRRLGVPTTWVGQSLAGGGNPSCLGALV